MRRQTIIAIFALGLILAAQTAFASPPKLITVQGKVTDSAGVPLPAGIKSFVFRIFNASSGGTQIWPAAGGEPQDISSDIDGLWSGALGAVSPLTNAVFADSVRWLEVTVNSQVLPRVRLVTGPYAMRVATVDGATGGTVSGAVRVNGVAEGVRIQGPDAGVTNNAYTAFYNAAGTRMGYVGDGSGADNDLFVAADAGRLNLETAGLRRLTVDQAGHVGIGTSPASGGTLLVRAIAAYAIAADGHTGGHGVFGHTSRPDYAGIWGYAFDPEALAGLFNGDVTVHGTITEDAASSKIDHPLDPANKYLSHSFVESPDMMNIYNGNATLDAKGEAAITLPDWFGALNKDFRYQLTAIGAPGPNLYISQEVTNNQFRIAGGKPGTKVSWMVTGIRQDAYANAHRIPVEEVKPTAERGFYRHPELFSQPEEKGVDWARHPEMMKQMKDEREKAASGGQ